MLNNFILEHHLILLTVLIQWEIFELGSSKNLLELVWKSMIFLQIEEQSEI